MLAELTIARTMLGRRQELNLQFLQIVDAFLIVLAFWSAHTFRFMGFHWGFFDYPILPFADFQWLLFVLVPFGPICLEAQGFYEHPTRKNIGKSLTQLGRAAIALGIIIAGCAYFLRLNVESRAVMPLFAFAAAILLLLRERASLSRYRRRVKSGVLREPILIVGNAADIAAFRGGFTPEQKLELDVVGEFNVETSSAVEFTEALHEYSVGRVMFIADHTQLGRLHDYITACEIEGVEAWLSADFLRTSIARPDFDAFGSKPMVVFRAAPSVSWTLMLKHLFDRSLALVVLILFSWLFLLIALAVRLSSKGPVIFRQARGGKNGRPFTMLKFRTMVTDAEMQQDELQRMNQMEGPVFKIDKDPRITPIGRFLRKTSLDELPQFWNVLRGEMSLVGPRPLPMYEVKKFETTAQRRRLAMKPGLTCLWQISGRNKITSFREWVKLDLEYIDNWSLWLDVKIIMKTVPVVLFGSGAK
jgi:exopolysaccharide biosynthesis polyprenyl glycosylphosphotransferase